MSTELPSRGGSCSTNGGAIPEILERWRREESLVHAERVPGRGAIHADLEPPLPPVLAARLAERGIERLYRHQAKAIRNLRERRHTVVVAGTAGGKTLCYQAPIAERALETPATTALCLYPTKALAHDQLRSFDDLRLPEVTAAAYDGDTPGEARTWARRRANVILTNPDMLHVGILPNHPRWADFFHRLELVVVDEMHTLRGIFGTHVAMILRRLRRVAALYGARPTFVFGSATIGNPGELAEALCGLPVEVIDDDASPTGERWVVLWNPPVTDPGLNRRRSTLTEATDRFVELVESGLHTIAFARSRRGTELMYRWARGRVGPERIAAYRAGYLPGQRRAIEARLFSGELGGVIATNALELGIDIGGLDAAVLATFPGTISSFRQQAGRAGRRLDTSLVTLVAGEDALDQYLATHPRELFDRPPEAVVVNPSNPLVAEAHTGCAAYELPITLEDRRVMGDSIEEAANRLVQQGRLGVKEGRLHWVGRRRPAPLVDIRSSGGATLVILADGEALGTVDEGRAYRDAHEGAVYLHQGETYVVERLDTSRRQVLVTARTVDYYTQPREDKQLEVIDLHAKDRLGDVGRHLGAIRVESHVVGYQRRKLGTREVLDDLRLDLPPTVYETEGIWLTIPPSVLEAARLDHVSTLGALHAAEHAAIGLLPLMAVCDRWDLGGLSTPWHPQTGTATIFIYEAYPGGAGISPVAYGAGLRHLRWTLEAVRDCPCADGCPSCVQSPKCGNLNEPLDKQGAVRLIEAILSAV